MGREKLIPPPPYRRPRESAMLDEAAPAISCVLWQFVRHLRDWIEVKPAQRRELFVQERKPRVSAKWADAQECASEVSESLAQLATFTQESRDLLAIANAAERIARWADERDYTETSIQMAEAAALLNRGEARVANLAGRYTRKAGDFLRAETWFERGIGLARGKRDWVEYTRGHLGAGILAMGLGRESRARRHFNTASSVAMREGHEWLAAEAQHDLFQFVTMRGNYVDAEVHARRALSWYPKHHPRFPFFVADVAFLMVCQRHFAPAVELLRRFVRTVKPPQNLLGYSLLVRALAGAGSLKEYHRRRSQLLKLIHATEWEAAARWNLAHAARETGELESALIEARSAAALARARCDKETEQLAEQLVHELEEGPERPAQAEVRRRDNRFRPLVEVLVSRLADWSPTRRGRSPVLSRSEWAA